MAQSHKRGSGYTGLGFSAFGLLVGALFFTASLTPSLMPRDALMQGVLAGTVAAIGYQLAVIGHHIWRYLMLPEPRDEVARNMAAVAIVIAVGVIGYGLWASHHWQDVTRLIMGMEPVADAHRLTIGGVAVVVFLILVVLFKLFAYAAIRVKELVQRIIPDRIAIGLGVIVALWVFWALIDGLLISRVLALADAGFEAADILVNPDTPAPADQMKAGSAASLVTWDELGTAGRNYVSSAPTVADIRAFHPTGDVTEALRVYVGRRSADTPQERAELALAELIRVGGFDRKTLIVMVPTGTGWMDAGSHDALEYILAGDVATVAVQYSYLTSFLALLVHPEYGITQGQALFDAVYEHWLTLPPETRPKFYVHGLSQGAFNSQMTFPLLDMLADPIDGALWVGSPFMSPFWARVRDNAEPDSPPWRPRYGNGSLMRVMNQDGGIEDARAPWGPIRLVFLNYASDAIVQFTFDSAFRRPAWLKGPLPSDISPEFRWFPLVTMFQIGLDMVISLQVPRFGHFYAYPDYIDAWAALLDPPGWSVTRSDELKTILAARFATP